MLKCAWDPHGALGRSLPFFFGGVNTAEAIDLEVVHVFEWHEEKLQTELPLTGRQMYFLR